MFHVWMVTGKSNLFGKAKLMHEENTCEGKSHEKMSYKKSCSLHVEAQDMVENLKWSSRIIRLFALFQPFNYHSFDIVEIADCH